MTDDATMPSAWSLGWVLAHYAVEDLVERLDEVAAEVVRWVGQRRAAAA